MNFNFCPHCGKSLQQFQPYQPYPLYPQPYIYPNPYPWQSPWYCQDSWFEINDKFLAPNFSGGIFLDTSSGTISATTRPAFNFEGCSVSTITLGDTPSEESLDLGIEEDEVVENG